MRHFRRGQWVSISGANAPPARVLFDTGDSYVIVESQKSCAKVDRRQLEVTVPPELQCVETEKGWCALQRQSRSVTRKELAEGAFTMCGDFVVTRSRPRRCGPTCPACLRAAHGG